MTTRQRMLSVMNNEKPDKLPWVPRLELWYKAHSKNNTLPGRYAGKSLAEVQKLLGVGEPARDVSLYKQEFDGTVQVEEKKWENRLEKTHRTPVGTVAEIFRRAAGSDYAWEHETYMIKTEEDYKVAEYLASHTIYTAQYDKYLEYEALVGEEGVPISYTGYDPMFAILQDLIGYNRAYYEYVDNPDKIKHLYRVMEESLFPLQEILINSPARVIYHGCHYDSMMTPPPIYDAYIKPYLRAFADQIHARGKLLTVHADGDSKLLLGSFLESGIDMVECFCTSPMVSVTFEEAVSFWGDKMIIWGGVPSTILCPANYSYEEFKDYMEQLFRTIKEKEARLILGVADNVMPEADIGRVEMITEMVDKFIY